MLNLMLMDPVKPFKVPIPFSLLILSSENKRLSFLPDCGRSRQTLLCFYMNFVLHDFGEGAYVIGADAVWEDGWGRAAYWCLGMINACTGSGLGRGAAESGLLNGDLSSPS